MSIDAMIGFLKRLNAYKKLSEFGVNETHIPRLAESATTIMAGGLKKNPIVPDYQQVICLYRESL
jgi:alcohol dehydrogenase class IV